MSQAKLKTAYVLSAIIAILMIVQSMGGLFLQGLYRLLGNMESTVTKLYRSSSEQQV
jgi:hypothetical protein